MLKKANINWTAKQLSKMYSKGSLTFDNAVQRAFVWDIKKKSLLIHSMMADYPIPPLYAAKGDGRYDMLDGKQRCNAIYEFLNDKFELSNVPEVVVENEDGTWKETEVNGLRFSKLDEKLQDAIKDYSLTLYYYDEITEDEVSEMFFRLNNGKAVSAIELTRCKAKSMKVIKEIGSHELFQNTLTEKALSRYTNEDIVIKSYAVLHEENPSLETKVIRPLMEEIEITEKDQKQLFEIYDRILSVHKMIEDKKIAKRLLTRTHLISIVPIVWKSLEEGLSEEQFAEWFVTFFAGKKSASISSTYNENAGAGSARKEAVRKRLEEIEKHWNEFFK